MFKSLKIIFTKFLVRTIGRTSDGIQMSFKYGFISGKMLDYIYANKPAGKFLIGKWIDRMYLSHPGWKVIRERKDNLVRALTRAIDLTLKGQKSVHILDVASGPAQYIIDVLQRFPADTVAAVCRDYDPKWVEEGTRKAAAAGLTNISFEQGDAFEADSFKEMTGTQDVVVSSGFYDWIVDDALVKKSMKIIYDVLRPGGYFVFTNQSGHVDLDMVEKIFIDFNKDPLRMKTRPEKLINGWAQDIGFEIVDTAADQKEYYSVTLALKK
ncbi:MAG TPA: class I SAM-dependent methyltransferase family protein [Candidatus Omnitrophota bacterium]|nr:class I SAM-dependent methyltransferase family protein [Candidatus Omnitrophota bacterium]HPN56783.1 class I SAM-dependent methyltransferase family protein [Candidatus Omnitrophota bacterium]